MHWSEQGTSPSGHWGGVLGIAVVFGEVPVNKHTELILKQKQLNI